MSSEKSTHYVDNAQFYKAIKEHKRKFNKAKREKTDPPLVSNYIGDCLLKIAKHLSYSPNFINYTFKEEMISDALENCLLYFNNFNPRKSKNPFAYFTQITYYAFVRRINREQMVQYTKYKYMSNKTDMDKIKSELYSDMGDIDSDTRTNILNNVSFYDNINEFILNFETKKEKKRKKQKKRNLEKFYKEKRRARA